MPQPTTSEVHVDTALSQIAVAYKLKAEDFIADKAFPVVPVKKQSDKVFKFTKEYWLRIVAGLRAPGAESRGGGFSIDSTTTYFADIHAVHMDLPLATARNSDIENLEQQVTEWVTQQLLMEREANWASTFFDDTGKTAGSDFWYVKTGGTDFTQWDDASSDPVKDINDAIIEITKRTGIRPNKLILGPEVFAALKTNAAVKALLAYAPGTPDVKPLVTAELLAKIWDLDEVLVSWATYTSSPESASSVSYNFILGKHALLVYAPPNPGILQPTGGYIFEWTEYGAGFSPAISVIDMPELKATRIEGEMAYDMVILGPDLGIFFKNAVS